MNKTFLYGQLKEAKKELEDLKNMLKLNSHFKQSTINIYQNEINTLKKQIKMIEFEMESI